MRSYFVTGLILVLVAVASAAATYFWLSLNSPPNYSGEPSPLPHHQRVADEIAADVAKELELLPDDHVLVRRYGRCRGGLAKSFRFHGTQTGGGPYYGSVAPLVVSVVGEFEKGLILFDVDVAPGEESSSFEYSQFEPTDESLASLGRTFREEVRDGVLWFVATDGADQLSSSSTFRVKAKHPEVFHSLSNPVSR